MAEKIAVENGQISKSEGLVTLTLDQVILHTIVRHSSTSTYMPNFIKIKEIFVDKHRTHVHTDGLTFETGFIRSTLPKSRPKNE